mgnify:CR=1 FL=1
MFGNVYGLDLGTYEIKVYDKKQGYRKATFKDIVILLRTTSNVAKIYEKELYRSY